MRRESQPDTHDDELIREKATRSFSNPCSDCRLCSTSPSKANPRRRHEHRVDPALGHRAAGRTPAGDRPRNRLHPAPHRRRSALPCRPAAGRDQRSHRRFACAAARGRCGPSSTRTTACTAPGSGEAFLLGPFLDVLPSAVVRQVKVENRRRTDQAGSTASAGRSIKVSGSVTSTIAATTTSAVGTPTASPSRP